MTILTGAELLGTLLAFKPNELASFKNMTKRSKIIQIPTSKNQQIITMVPALITERFEVVNGIHYGSVSDHTD